MKIDDAVWGAALVVLAGLLLIHVQSFPAMPGQRIGPAVMPGIIAVGLGVCGAVLFVHGLRKRGTHGAGGAAPWVTWPAWLLAPRQALGFVVLVAVHVFYLLAVNRLGFVLTGAVYLAALMLVLRVRPLAALGLALVVTLLIHSVFYKLLKVPLPWGLLQPVAW